MSGGDGGKIPRIQRSDVREYIVRSTTPPNPYVTGYGGKIPTRYMLRLTDGRVRRVYVMTYGNGGTPYVLVRGVLHLLPVDVEYRLRPE